MLFTILIVSVFIYYLGLMSKCKIIFEKQGKKLNIKTIIYMPFYIIKMSFSHSNFEGLKLVDLIASYTKVFLKFDIYLVIFNEVIIYTTQNKYVLNYEEVFNRNTNLKYREFITRGIY